MLLPGERLPIAVENVAEGWPAMHRRLAGLRGAVDTAPPTAPPGAVHIRATQAPALAAAPGRRLPPGVVPLEEATFGHGASRRRPVSPAGGTPPH